MKFLVTGGLGFIGHHVVAKLLQQKHQVVIIDSCKNWGLQSKAHFDHLIEERKQFVQGADIYYVSITDEWAMDGIVSEFRPDTVIHLASYPSNKNVKAQALDCTKTMCMGLINTLDCSTKAGVKKFVYISSSMIYGNWKDAIKEDQINLTPAGVYGTWKLAGEMLVKNYATDQMKYTVLRPSAVYGPRDNTYRIIPKFFTAALENDLLHVNGRWERLDFTYVDDLADGIIDASMNQSTDNNTYNLTRGNATLIYDAAMRIVKTVGKGLIHINTADSTQPSRSTLDCSKALANFGFKPKVDLDAGLQNYWNWLIATGRTTNVRQH